MSWILELALALCLLIVAGGYSVYHILSSPGSKTNSMLKVEVGIMLKATFTLESDQ